MSIVQNLQDFASLLDEGIATEHPDIAGQTEFQKKADAILERRKKRRAELNDPKARRARKAAEFFSKSVIRKEETEMTEEHMTTADKRKEEGLKKKYDKSGMKASMIKQYGPEKGKQVYFATIRKQAMEEYKPLPAKKMLKQAGRHKFYAGWVQGEWEANRFNKRKKAPLAKEMVGDANKKADKIHDTVLSHKPDEAKSKSKYKAESYGHELDEAKISKTERRARNAAKVKRGSAVHAFDVDETLFGHGKKGKPDVKVHVNDSSGKRVQSLTNQEFNTHKLPKGHSYDFSEFRSSKKFAQTSSPNKSMIKKVQKLQKRGKNVHLITARDKFDNPEEFRKHFTRHGIKLTPGQIHYTGGMKGGDIGQKKLSVIRGLQKIGGAKKAHMYDDAAKVHKAMEKANKETPTGPKIKTHLAKPNKRGTVMSRSYQATKEEFELFVNALVHEGYNLDKYSAEDLIDVYLGLSEQLDNAPSHSFSPVYSSFYESSSKERLQEDVELTPYEYWKSFLDEADEEASPITEEAEEVKEEKVLTSYDYWKSVLANKE